MARVEPAKVSAEYFGFDFWQGDGPVGVLLPFILDCRTKEPGAFADEVGVDDKLGLVFPNDDDDRLEEVMSRRPMISRLR
jgi:hypothetical protein